MRRIGFLVNPIAGMGGRVGLKGTDGLVEEARRRGAEPRSPDRARRGLEALAAAGADVHVLTWGAPMGAQVAADVGLATEVLGGPASDETSAEDTREAVRTFVAENADVVCFAGGDGTAVDVAETIDAVGAGTPILGIPAGVKVFSSVFAVTPEAAGEILATFERTEEREVLDLDETAYRKGEVEAELRAVFPVPIAEDLQSGKHLAGGSVEGIAAGVVARMEPERAYFLGPGSTVGAIKDELGIDGSPLGVDVFRGGELLATDAAAGELLAFCDRASTIVVSPIGGQGFVFGRGNDQFSPEVIRGSDLLIVASREKLADLGALRVDTGDPDVDEALRGWTRVRTGRVEERMIQIV